MPLTQEQQQRKTSIERRMRIIEIERRMGELEFQQAQPAEEPESQEPETQPGFLQNLLSDLQQRGGKVKEILQSELPSPVQFGLIGLQGAGFVGGDVPIETAKSAYNRFASEGLKRKVGIAGALADTVLHSKIGKPLVKTTQAVGKGYGALKKQSPEAAMILEGVLNVPFASPAKKIAVATLKSPVTLGKWVKESALQTRDLYRFIKPASQGITKDMLKISLPQGKTSAEMAGNLKKNARAFSIINENKGSMEYITPKGFRIGGTPENTHELLQAIGNVKPIVHNKYHSIAVAMNDKVRIELNNLASVLERKADELFMEDRYPSMNKKLKKQAEKFRTRGSYSPVEAEKALQTLNDTLASFKANPGYDITNLKKMDDAIAKEIRTELKLKLGEEYASHRRDYGSLLNLEGDIYNKAYASGKSGLDLGSVYSVYAGTRGLVTMNPAVLTAVAAATSERSIGKLFASPSHAVKNIFRRLNAGENKSMAGKKISDFIAGEKAKQKSVVDAGIRERQPGIGFTNAPSMRLGLPAAPPSQGLPALPMPSPERMAQLTAGENMGVMRPTTKTRKQTRYRSLKPESKVDILRQLSIRIPPKGGTALKNPMEILGTPNRRSFIPFASDQSHYEYLMRKPKHQWTAEDIMNFKILDKRLYTGIKVIPGKTRAQEVLNSIKRKQWIEQALTEGKALGKGAAEIERQIVEFERLRQSLKGGELLKKSLEAKDLTWIQRIRGMNQ